MYLCIPFPINIYICILVYRHTFVKPKFCNFLFDSKAFNLLAKSTYEPSKKFVMEKENFTRKI